MPEDLNICVDDAYIKLRTSISLLGITLKSHVSSIYKSASCQLNALFRLKKLSRIQRKENFQSQLHCSKNEGFH